MGGLVIQNRETRNGFVRAMRGTGEGETEKDNALEIKMEDWRTH